MKLLFCVPTYNRASVVKQLLEDELPIFKKFGIHCKVYDSSIEEGTKQVINKFKKRGYENLEYCHMNPNLHSAEKVFQIYQEVADMDYDYIWLSHDHTFFMEEYIEKVIFFLEKERDYYTLIFYRNAESYIEIDDLDDFLVNEAYQSIRFGTTIINRKRFLKKIDWNYFSRKLLIDEKMNFSHVGLYFERATQIKRFKAAECTIPSRYYKDYLVHIRENWYDDSIRLFTECWSRNILELPDVYKEKEKAVRNINHSHFSINKLRDLKSRGHLSSEIFEKYKKWIKIVCPEKYELIYEVAKQPLCWVEQYEKNLIFSKLSENRKLYIFGAGRVAVGVARNLISLDIPFEGFVVSSVEGNKTEVEGHYVKEARKELHNKKAYLIMGVTTAIFDEVSEYINEMINEGYDLKYGTIE